MACRVRYNGAAPEDNFTATIVGRITRELDNIYDIYDIYDADHRRSGNPVTGYTIPKLINNSFILTLGIAYNANTKTATLYINRLRDDDDPRGYSRGYAAYKYVWPSDWPAPSGGESYKITNANFAIHRIYKEYIKPKNFSVSYINGTDAGVHVRPWRVRVHIGGALKESIIGSSGSTYNNGNGMGSVCYNPYPSYYSHGTDGSWVNGNTTNWETLEASSERKYNYSDGSHFYFGTDVDICYDPAKKSITNTSDTFTIVDYDNNNTRRKSVSDMNYGSYNSGISPTHSAFLLNCDTGSSNHVQYVTDHYSKIELGSFTFL